jgi:flagellar L-ring protein precursor FlgH
MAAIIAAVLPNGNFVLNGNQEVRVNYELRDLQIAGVVRPQDITAENTVTYDKIAEARIACGGRGQLFDVQQPRYGQQVLDMILPF